MVSYISSFWIVSHWTPVYNGHPLEKHVCFNNHKVHFPLDIWEWESYQKQTRANKTLPNTLWSTITYWFMKSLQTKSHVFYFSCYMETTRGSNSSKTFKRYRWCIVVKSEKEIWWDVIVNVLYVLFLFCWHQLKMNYYRI